MTPREIGTINATIEVLEWYRDKVLSLSLSIVGGRTQTAMESALDLQADMGNRAAAALAYLEKLK